MLNNTDIEQVKNVATIYDVVSDYVTLKQSGSNYKGYCPVHSEKDPSFYINIKMNICKCFGCGFSADPIGFIMEIENVNYINAIKLLAEKYNIKLTKNKKDSNLYSLNKKIAKFFHKKLLNAPKLMEYLIKKRNINIDIIKQFKLGYAPKHNYLKNINTAKLLKLGLLVKKDNKTFLKFYNRIMFPYRDSYGRYIGFNSRRINNTDTAKYLNTSNTKLFKKSKQLYGLYNAKKYIQDKALLVEGNFDVLRFFQIGIKETISPNGTAVSRSQARKLKKYAKRVTLIFDGDSAGNEAAFRSGFVFLKENLPVTVLSLPDNTDPDNYFNSKQQFLEYEKLNSISFIDYWFSHKNIQTIQDKYSVINIIKKELKDTIPILKEMIANEIANKLKVKPQTILKGITKSKKKPNINKDIINEFSLLGKLIKTNNKDIFNCKYFRYKITRKICKILKYNEINKNGFILLNDKIDKKYIKMLNKYSLQDTSINTLKNKLKIRYNKSKLEYYQKQLQKAEDNNDKDKINKIFDKIIKLKNT